MLADVQNLLKKLVRDVNLFDELKKNGFSDVKGYNLSGDEIEYLNEINVESFSQFRDIILNERISKRLSEYQLFAIEMAKYSDYQTLARQFVETYNFGSLDKVYDAKQYYLFFTNHLLKYKFPNYLFCLLKFCHYNSFVAWVDYNPPALDYIDDHLNINDRFVFTHHYEVITVGEDFVRFMGIDTKECSQLTKLVLVKQPNNPKSSAYHVLGNSKILALTFKKIEISVLELLDGLTIDDIRESIDELNSLISQGFIKYFPAKTAP